MPEYENIPKDLFEGHEMVCDPETAILRAGQIWAPGTKFLVFTCPDYQGQHGTFQASAIVALRRLARYDLVGQSIVPEKASG